MDDEDTAEYAHNESMVLSETGELEGNVSENDGGSASYEDVMLREWSHDNWSGNACGYNVHDSVLDDERTGWDAVLRVRDGETMKYDWFMDRGGYV